MKRVVSALAAIGGATLIGVGTYGFLFNLPMWGMPILIGMFCLFMARGVLE